MESWVSMDKRQRQVTQKLRKSTGTAEIIKTKTRQRHRTEEKIYQNNWSGSRKGCHRENVSIRLCRK